MVIHPMVTALIITLWMIPGILTTLWLIGGDLKLIKIVELPVILLLSIVAFPMALLLVFRDYITGKQR